MKQILLLTISVLSQPLFAQMLDEEKILKQISDKACQCIDSIAVQNREKIKVINDISGCIDEQTDGLQLMLKLNQTLAPLETYLEKGEGEHVVESKGDVEIAIDFNKNSQEYRDYYYKIERYLMQNCESMIEKVASNDMHNEKSVSKNPEALRFYELGVLESKDQNFEKANEYYREALRIDPNFAFAWDNMGLNYRRMNQFDKAIEAYENSLKLDPAGKMPLQNSAIVYVYQKDFKKAIEAYERLGKIYPGDPEVYYGLAHIYTDHLDQPELALDYACKAYIGYLDIKSPYRTDAEHMISVLYFQMEKKNQIDQFKAILKKYNLNWAD